MELLYWLVQRFGLFFGAAFLVYIYLILRRFFCLYDLLRWVPASDRDLPQRIEGARYLDFIAPLLARLGHLQETASTAREVLIDAIWSEVECKVAIHFTALNGYANTLILIGFAGTIFGSIGAFKKMFDGLAHGGQATAVLVSAWNNGLDTALYTSLGAAAIGGILLTALYSRRLLGRARRLDTLISLRIGEILEENCSWDTDIRDEALSTEATRTPAKTCLPISSS
jgi:hypothetical protein